MDKSLKGAVAEDDEITLGLLDVVEANSQITQRSIARELGIALGLANAYLKRCVRKGWVKVNSVPANRYSYFLTPTGFAEKSRLTADYLSSSFNFFRRARSQCSEAFGFCVARGWRRIALAGVGDLAEIAVLCADELRIDLVGIVTTKSSTSRFAGLPVFETIGDLPAYDAIVVTDFRNAQGTYEGLIDIIGAERVVTPKLLRVSRERPNLAE